MMCIFLFCQFDNSHYRTFRPLLKNSIFSYREYSQKHIDTHIAAMKQRAINFFLNDKIILAFIVINFITIFVQESGYRSPVLTYIDCGISLIFLIEMIVKHYVYGIKEYWKDAWNRFDGILVLVTTPSLLNMFISMNMNLSFLMVLRVLRAFKMF